MRYRFSEVFHVSNGSISPKTQVQMGGVSMGPGVIFGSGVSFSGIDLSQHVGKDIEGDIENRALNIKGFYN